MIHNKLINEFYCGRLSLSEIPADKKNKEALINQLIDANYKNILFLHKVKRENLTFVNRKGVTVRYENSEKNEHRLAQTINNLLDANLWLEKQFERLEKEK